MIIIGNMSNLLVHTSYLVASEPIFFASSQKISESDLEHCVTRSSFKLLEWEPIHRSAVHVSTQKPETVV